MPTATPVHIRQKIVARRTSGESLAQIGRDLSMPYITVWKIYHDYQVRGYLEPNYERCHPPEVKKARAIYDRALEVRRGHPGWGAGLIWVELPDQFEEGHLPCVRTLQRWFKRVGLNPPRREKVQTQVVRRGQRAHDVWAIDAKEQIQLLDGSYVSWLTISDEASGAILEVDLFPPTTLDTNRSPTSAAVFTKNDDTVGNTAQDPDG